MAELFLKIVNMSISASWLVLAVLVLRVVLKKAPKWVNVLLWGLVAVRLLCPFTVESALSLIPSAETISPEIMTDPTPTIHTGIYAFNSVVNPVISQSFAPDPAASANPLQIWIPVWSVFWLLGVAVLCVYTAVSYWRLRRKVDTAVLLRDNIYESEFVSSPFVLGVIRPKIFLPMGMDAQTLGHVIAHEQAHIHRRDHWWKPLGFLLLTLHWFNPLMWLGYVLLCRDIELACDEKVIRALGNEQRADYSQALLDCSIGRRMIAACPLAFGETGVKHRVKSVLHYKQPGFWVVVISMMACMAAALCFLTDPMGSGGGYSPQEGFYLVIGEDGVTNIEITTPNSGGGCSNADGSPFEKGETVYLEHFEPLEGITDLRGVSITAMNAQGEILFALSIPEEASEADIVQRVERSGWLLAPVQTVPQLTLDDVISLSEKGYDLTWSDFAEFEHHDTGSGLYIWHFEIDEMFSLQIGGGNPCDMPMYIYLTASDGFDSCIDIRDGGVEEFIAEHRDRPVVKNTTAGWNISPVGSSEEIFREMQKLGSISDKAMLSSIQYLFVATVRSVAELDTFTEATADYMEFDRSYPDAPSFAETLAQYDDSYFAETTLFLMYIIESNNGVRHTIEYVTATDGTLSIGIQRLEPDEFTDVQEGWLIAVGVPNDQLTNITAVNACISSTVYVDQVFPSGELIRAYVFEDSEDIIKPCLALYDDGTFQFTFSALSSYIGIGTYAIENDRLTLHTDDANFTYVFDMVDNTLVFDADVSSQMVWFSGLYDGAVMK